MDYNNHPDTTLAEIHSLLQTAQARLEKGCASVTECRLLALVRRPRCPVRSAFEADRHLLSRLYRFDPPVIRRSILPHCTAPFSRNSVVMSGPSLRGGAHETADFITLLGGAAA
jgi:hypothetical protein